MGNDELKAAILAIVPAATPELIADWPAIRIPPDAWSELAARLRNDSDLLFDYLFCITCIDWKTHLEMVYHLRSIVFRHELVVKSILEKVSPEIATAAGTWKTAIFHEREVYEMFGVHFTGHPDLRLLILPDGWEGKNPMRKDFEDPVNMIRL